jgi:hypothetical protein
MRATTRFILKIITFVFITLVSLGCLTFYLTYSKTLEMIAK